MDGLHPVPDEKTLPDVFLDAVPYQITHALTYWLLRHHAECGAPITLPPWESWDRLGERLGTRLGQHVWHPSHWDAYYATLPEVPASTPGAVPLTMAMVREDRREAARTQLDLLEVA